MERRNIMMDADTLEAADYLKTEYYLATTSAAIRYAVQTLAKREGWRSDRPTKRRRRPAPPPPEAVQ